MSQINSEDVPEYKSDPEVIPKLNGLTLSEIKIIDQAVNIIDQKFKNALYLDFDKPKVFDSPSRVLQFCKIKIGYEESEKFAVLFLDTRHRLISFDIMFHGTIDGASVHPREIIKEALQYNAAAMILTHNHPSGICDPSQADKMITTRIVDAAKLMEIRVLDHIIVGEEYYSFASHGLM